MGKRRTITTPDFAERLSVLKSCGSNFSWKRGIAAWERGEGFPPRPNDDDDHSDVFWLWAGFMIARALDHDARAKLARMMGHDSDSVELDPPSTFSKDYP
jgi:hypothetical protein